VRNFPSGSWKTNLEKGEKKMEIDLGAINSKNWWVFVILKPLKKSARRGDKSPDY